MPHISNLLLIITLSIISLPHSSLHECGADNLQDSEIKGINTNSKSPLRALDPNDYQPIRIHIAPIQFEPSTMISSQLQQYTTAILSETAHMIQKLLNVPPITNTLSLPFDNCVDSHIPHLIQSKGVNADLILFPYIDSTLETNVQASALYCSFDRTTGRPLAGQISINPLSISIRPNSNYHLQMLFFHEISHILAFSKHLFSHFLKPDGTEYGNDALIQSTVNNLPRTKLATPNVVAAARKHFGCDTIDGIELENQGGNGSIGSHWESRIMLGDYMISSLYSEVVISDITLAVFEDSGWYKVNKYTGGLFRFGQNQGCKFFDSKCIENSHQLSNNDFCIIKDQSRCSAGRTSKGKCIIKDDSSPDSSYQYFSDKKQGGFLPADYCPVSYIPKNINFFFGGSCKYGQQEPDLDIYNEVLGDTSVCMISSLIDENLSETNKPQAVCLEVLCSEDRLSVIVGGKQYECPRQGGKVTGMHGFKGDLYCPDYNLICSGSVWCNDPIECINKKSMTKDFNYDYITQDSQLASSFVLKCWDWIYIYLFGIMILL